MPGLAKGAPRTLLSWRARHDRLRVEAAAALGRRRLEEHEAAGVLRVAQAGGTQGKAVAVEHEHLRHAAERGALAEQPVEVEQVRVELHLRP